MIMEKFYFSDMFRAESSARGNFLVPWEHDHKGSSCFKAVSLSGVASRLASHLTVDSVSSSEVQCNTTGKS